MNAVKRTNEEWIAALAGDGREAAIADLRAVLIRGLGRTFSSRADVAAGFVEDFVQEALVKILDNLESFRGDSRFTTWALSIAVHIGFTELRRRRWKDVSLDQVLTGVEAGTPSPVDGTASAETRVARGEITAVLRRVIDEELTERQRRALLAEFAGEMPLDEIARQMGTSRNALYKLLYDARQRLRSRMLATGLTAEAIRAAFDL